MRCHRPTQHIETMKMFDIQSFNRRAIKLLVIDARVMDGTLMEDELVALGHFYQKIVSLTQ